MYKILTKFLEFVAMNKCVPLHIAALKGDRESVQSFDDDELKSKITDQGETALHIAAAAKNLPFIEKLMSRIKVAHEYLETESKSGNTALCYAAVAGNVEIARVMLDAYSNVANSTNNCFANPLANRGRAKPLLMAAVFGQCDMVKYLLDCTKIEDWSGEERVELFTNCISIGLCGEALEMLGVYPELATTRNRDKETALQILARRLSVFEPQSQPGWNWRTHIGLGEDNENPKSEAADLVKELYHQAMKCPDLERANRVKEVAQALFAAAEDGNVDFIIELLRCDPDLVWRFNKKTGTIFHIAIRNRHESIFSLLHEFGSIQDLIAAKTLEGNRNMLHLAAELAPQAQLNMVSGAALQMQRELLWYREVEKIMQPSYMNMENSKGRTPYMLFTERHNNLKAAGEKWMKETAKSSMVVAALIATVMFTTAFTVPGGYDNSTGEPIFENRKCFLIFFVADALALLCSSTSILMFHSIITSRYTEYDFLESLPFRLMVGVTSLFVSVAAMMVAFCATFPLFFPHDDVPWVFALFGLFACVPSLYVSLKYPLVADLIRSTHDSRFMFQPQKQLFL